MPPINPTLLDFFDDISSYCPLHQTIANCLSSNSCAFDLSTSIRRIIPGMLLDLSNHFAVLELNKIYLRNLDTA